MTSTKFMGVEIFQHKQASNTIYAFKANSSVVVKFMDKLYNMYNSVKITNQINGYNMVNPDLMYVEITCN